MTDVLAVLHLSGRAGTQVKGKDGGLGYAGKLAVSRRDWQKVRAYLEGTWPQPIPSAVVGRPFGAVAPMHAWFDRAHGAEFVALDTEYNPTTRELNLVGLGFATAESYDILQYQWYGHQATLGRDAFVRDLRELVRVVPVVMQNSAADVPVLEKAMGLRWQDYRQIEDTMLAHAVLWSEWPHTLEFLASLYGVHPKMKHLKATDPLIYNRGDVVDTINVWRGLRDELARDPGSSRVYREQSLPLVPIVLEAMARGIAVDQDRVRKAGVEYEGQIEEAARLAVAYVGYPLKLGSPKQLQWYLYQHEGLPQQTNKDTGKPTIDDDAVAILRSHVGPPPDPDEPATVETSLARIHEGAHPVLEARVLYAEAKQVQSHYIKPMQGAERIYPLISIHAQSSGRWSITKPPLQQLPKKLRGLLIPDTKWIKWDYDQIELRLLAALANDLVLLDMFDRGDDVHTFNACAAFDLPAPPSWYDPHTDPMGEAWRERIRWEGKDDLRRVFAKRFEYRLDYGGHPCFSGDIPGARALGLTPADLVLAARRRLASRPALAVWQARTAAEAHRTRVSRTFLGRMRRLMGDAKTKRCPQCQQRLPSSIARAAFDHPMQGGVSDVLNLTLIRIKRECPWTYLAWTMHDSVWLQCPPSEYEATLATIKAIIDEPWDVYGVKVQFPATFEGEKRDD